jgi:ribosomal protein L11 methyltransferase
VIRLAVRCPPELGEAVLAQLLEIAPGGVEEAEHGDRIEYAIYGAPGELPILTALEAAIGKGVIEVESTEIPDDWGDRWRDFHQPTVIGEGRVVVRPSWRQPMRRDAEHPGGDPAGPGRGAKEPAGIDVVVDPGQAFGTGAHATTAMCIEMLLDLADADTAPGSLVDLGTGSGVLAIIAAKLGFAPVIGCDHERAALEAAEANARANGVDLELRRLNLRTERPPAAQTVVANLTAPLLHEVAARLAFAPRAVIVSGLLQSEADEIAGALERGGLTLRERRGKGEWVAMLLLETTEPVLDVATRSAN